MTNVRFICSYHFAVGYNTKDLFISLNFLLCLECIPLVDLPLLSYYFSNEVIAFRMYVFVLRIA
jgi:hypothetical protein